MVIIKTLKYIDLENKFDKTKLNNILEILSVNFDKKFNINDISVYDKGNSKLLVILKNIDSSKRDLKNIIIEDGIYSDIELKYIY